MRLKRRLVSPVVALLVALGVMLPSRFGWISEHRANEITLALLAVTFASLVILFAVERRLMTQRVDGRPREVTLFGVALLDNYGALIVLFGASFLLYGLWTATVEGWMQFTVNRLATVRALLAAGCVLVLGTGLGVAWEIRRSRAGVAVHVPPADDRVIYSGPERRTRDRRANWPPSKGDAS